MRILCASFAQDTKNLLQVRNTQRLFARNVISFQKRPGSERYKDSSTSRSLIGYQRRVEEIANRLRVQFPLLAQHAAAMLSRW
jgi:hypothetical protein